MAKFINDLDLYNLVQEKSASAKDTLWVCSPYLGYSGHQVFSQTIVKEPPRDLRFIFRVNDLSVKHGEVNPYEIQYFVEHFSNVRTHNFFHCKMYIFDDAALISSANLTKSAFESNVEVGVLLEGKESVEAKDFFVKALWEEAASVKNVEKYKRLWNINKPTPIENFYKNKKHTRIKELIDDCVPTWYFNVPFYFSKKTEQKIKKETNLPKTISILGDISPLSFRNLKLGDLVFIPDLNKRGRKVEVELGRVYDKCKVETDEGDYHFAYETEKTYKVERNKLITTLQTLNLSKKTDVTLGIEQIQAITKLLTRKKR